MENILQNLPVILAIIIGIYEVVSRSIPTVANISLLHYIIELLRWISDRLNNKKKR